MKFNQFSAVLKFVVIDKDSLVFSSIYAELPNNERNFYFLSLCSVLLVIIITKTTIIIWC